MNYFSDDEVRKNVRARLIELRKANNLTQTEVGNIVKKSKTAVASWEQGLSIPDVETLFELSRYYGKTISYMYGYPEEQTSNDFVDMEYSHDPEYPIDIKVTRGEYKLILELRERKEIDVATLEEMFNTILQYKQQDEDFKLLDKHMKFRITAKEFLEE